MRIEDFLIKVKVCACTKISKAAAVILDDINNPKYGYHAIGRRYSGKIAA